MLFGHEDLLLELFPLASEYIISSVGGLEMPAVGSSSVERRSFMSYGHCRSEEPGQGHLSFEETTRKCLLDFGGRWCGRLPWSVDWC